MKPVRTFGIILLLLALLLTGCSSESLVERGVGLLDELFAGDHIQPIPSSPEAEPDPEPAPDTAEPSVTGAEEPDIVDEAPSVPDGSQPATDPVPTPEPPAPEPSTSAGDITPSHTDITFFGPDEFVHYVPKGVTGTYACTYASGNDKVAAVDQNTGKITAVGPGTTKVTMHVESNGQYDFECIVRCNWKADSKEDAEPVLPPSPSATTSKPAATTSKPAATTAPTQPEASGGITASHSDITFFNPKENVRFVPQGAGDDAAVSYTTGDSTIAEVDGKTGRITAVGPGTTTVTMTVDAGGTDYIFQCTVRCSW